MPPRKRDKKSASPSPQPPSPKGKKRLKKKLPSSSDSPTRTSPLWDSPLGFFLSPFRPTTTQWGARYMYVSFALIIRAAVALGPYSGFQQPPMHGDFEAQRHWMEITTALPTSKWYFYDLQWWGLDYPPLTAYHSWLCGVIGKYVNPEWFELDASRGCDAYGLKTFMRLTVLLSELLIYIPPVISFAKWTGKQYGYFPTDLSISAAAIIFQPALILVDHGHFQYNSVMLGLALLAFVNLNHQKYVVASFFFVASLCFKQMALYYSPVIFAFLLGLCVFPKINLRRFISIGVTVIVSFGVFFLPLILGGGMDQVKQCLIRVFPFGRGLWEDKVANFWCAGNTFFKFKLRYTSEQLQMYSLTLTLAAILPVMLIVFFNPKRKLIPWAFAACSWAFYLFSFQVHEKSVLVPLLPSTLLLATLDGNVISLVTWINNVAVFSMWPLLRRENLQLQYFVVLFLWNWLLGNFEPSRLWTATLPKSIFWRLVVIGFYVGMVALQVAEYLYPKVDRFPDLWVVGNVLLCAPCFALFWLYTLWNLWDKRGERA
ncbi:glycosyl transferase [Yarrowia lipolytica]|uniref:Alpha-1,3-glucosyltransferase n=1 Tax=Yarrowia lipolytica TaxID=4952 RepID=A0A371C2Z9_YARLL|nr:glycosyl transferase [Yarrowia lipolytica]RDW30865.1 glycosyl transferase [Yarrowia lipolytica]RDW38838.1 glycosyl transferase [Yarrowia lipolytica]RDW44697.1 glycosyl transferase [Yarrowia lipolytica]RDW55084.1 glycosyl transferase [Yarrowia lipolytica]